MHLWDFSFRSDEWKQFCVANPQGKKIFITFDDGPYAETLPELLKLLEKHSCKATFFWVLNRARPHVSMLKEVLAAGHSFGDHSVDHDYRRYLGAHQKISNWVSESWDQWGDLMGEAPVGFRPPAGVLTPPLLKVLKERKIPLLLWNHRFFDATHTLSPEKFLRSMQGARSGDIVLLHEQFRLLKHEALCNTLQSGLLHLREQGFELSGLKGYV